MVKSASIATFWDGFLLKCFIMQLNNSDLIDFLRKVWFNDVL